jgi:hypothetical protein
VLVDDMIGAHEVCYGTSAYFNIGALATVLALTALYATWS